MTKTFPYLDFQGYNPKSSHESYNQDHNYTTNHLPGARVRIEKVGGHGDAIITIDGKSLMLPRFDNICCQIIDYLRSQKDDN